MHHFLFMIIILTSAATSSATASSESISWWESANTQINSLRPDRCHTGLTDLASLSLFPQSTDTMNSSSREKIFSLRMKLNKLIGDWYLQDSQLSLECQKIALSIQQKMERHEDQIAARIYRNAGLVETQQKVFTHSNYQLQSNPWLDPASRVTALNDLKNGDVVVQMGSDGQERYSLIYKMENGQLKSLEQQLDFSWALYDIHDPLSWLKRPLIKVFILRASSDSEAERMVSFALKRVGGRWPSTIKSSQVLFEKSPLQQGAFLRVMEWKNFQALNSATNPQ